MPRDTPDPDLSDDVLVARYAAGDPAAARALTLRLAPRALALAARLLGGDRAEAEDVAQEAMLRLWRAAPGWRPGEAQVSTWLYRVVVNLVTDRLRARQRRGGVPLGLEDAPEVADATPGIETRMHQTARLAALERALSDLPERQRMAVVLRHLEGLSNPEIAEVMAIGIEAVESLTARGKRALAAALQGQKAALGHEGDGDDA